MPRLTWQIRGRMLTIERPLVMGIVNVTPDSFSDGGRFFSTEAAVQHARRLVAEGADILDIGGESTRPGSHPVPLAEELQRVIPVVQALRDSTVPISVDTSKFEVAQQALDAGASIINDVTALRDGNMVNVVRGAGAGVILMHMQGSPATMQSAPSYRDVVGEIFAFLQERIQNILHAGLSREQVAVDPGIGFGKTLEHTMAQLRSLAELQRLGRPVCLGVSRKGFIGEITGRARDQRLAGSLAVLGYGLAQGAIQIARVHDVAASIDAVKIFHALSRAPA